MLVQRRQCRDQLPGHLKPDGYIDSLNPKPLRCEVHAAGAPTTFVRGVNREAGASRVITLDNPGTAPATVDECGIDSANPFHRMGQTATAPQAREGGPSGDMPLMSPETDLL